MGVAVAECGSIGGGPGRPPVYLLLSGSSKSANSGSDKPLGAGPMGAGPGPKLFGGEVSRAGSMNRF